ncbi:MAG: aldehyde ferredoxin oxidoreductase N-terminal domain-containing protein, partial [Nitrososphaerota archaeon]
MSGRGYAGKYAEIDLSTGSVKVVRFSEEVLRKYVGGRGLGVKILWDRLGEKWDEVDPLGPENILLFLTGPLTGFFPGGRICITGKSPQSNGVVGSTIAGEFPVELKCAGWDGLIITGEAEKPSYILVKDSEIDIRDASHVWGLDAKKTYLTLVKEVRNELNTKNPLYGEWKEPAIYMIG